MSKRTIVRRPTKKAITEKSGIKQAPVQMDDEARSWQQMHIISGRWQSDLVFFYDEINFLRKLIDKYFMWLVEEDNIENTRKVASDLSRLEKRRFSLLQNLDQHRRHVAAMVENPFSHDGQECRDEHSEIEVLFVALAKDFRQTKKDVFDITEHVIDSEKMKRLLNGNS